MLMISPPGSGKSMLAARLPGLMPDLDGEAAGRSATILLSLVGQFRPGNTKVRPRQPRHILPRRWPWSAAAAPPAPGRSAWRIAASCSSSCQFDRKVLKPCANRSNQPHPHRPGGAPHVPAEFQLIAAMNRESGHGAPEGKCRCNGPDRAIAAINRS